MQHHMIRIDVRLFKEGLSDKPTKSQKVPLTMLLKEKFGDQIDLEELSSLHLSFEKFCEFVHKISGVEFNSKKCEMGWVSVLLNGENRYNEICDELDWQNAVGVMYNATSEDQDTEPFLIHFWSPRMKEPSFRRSARVQSPGSRQSPSREALPAMPRVSSRSHSRSQESKKSTASPIQGHEASRSATPAPLPPLVGEPSKVADPMNQPQASPAWNLHSSLQSNDVVDATYPMDEESSLPDPKSDVSQSGVIEKGDEMIMSSPTSPSHMPRLVSTDLDLVEHNMANPKNPPPPPSDEDSEEDVISSKQKARKRKERPNFDADYETEEDDDDSEWEVESPGLINAAKESSLAEGETRGDPDGSEGEAFDPNALLSTLDYEEEARAIMLPQHEDESNDEYEERKRDADDFMAAMQIHK